MTSSPIALSSAVAAVSTYNVDGDEAFEVAEARREALAVEITAALLADAPTLTGSDKQLAWGSEVRTAAATALGWALADQRVFDDPAQPADQAPAFAEQFAVLFTAPVATEASWWIGSRTLWPTIERVQSGRADLLRLVAYRLTRHQQGEG